MTKAKSELIAQDLASKIKHQQFKDCLLYTSDAADEQR